MTITEHHLKAAIFHAYINKHIKDPDIANLELVKYCKELGSPEGEARAGWVQFIRDLIGRQYVMDISRVGLNGYGMAELLTHEGKHLETVSAGSLRHIEAAQAALNASLIAGYKPQRPANPPRPLQYVKIIQVPITAEMYHDLLQESKTLGVSLSATVRSKL